MFFPISLGRECVDSNRGGKWLWKLCRKTEMKAVTFYIKPVDICSQCCEQTSAFVVVIVKWKEDWQTFHQSILRSKNITHIQIKHRHMSPKYKENPIRHYYLLHCEEAVFPKATKLKHKSSTSNDTLYKCQCHLYWRKTAYLVWLAGLIWCL